MEDFTKVKNNNYSNNVTIIIGNSVIKTQSDNKQVFGVWRHVEKVKRGRCEQVLYMVQHIIK